LSKASSRTTRSCPENGMAVSCIWPRL
jgi:hypothetical protein